MPRYKSVFQLLSSQIISLLLIFLPVTVSAQGERYDLSLGDYKYPKYNTLDTNIPNYVIVKGDNLWNLSLKFYHVGNKWHYIWEHNKYIKDPHWIYPGNPLFIPGLSQTPPPQSQNFDSLDNDSLDDDDDDVYIDIDDLETQEFLLTDESLDDEIDDVEMEEPTPVDANPKVKSGKKRYFLFSLRPEMFSTNTITGVGANMELGAISAKGFYFSLDLSGGKFYYGGGFDIGGCLGKDRAVKSVFGICGGYWNLISIVNVKKDQNILDSTVCNNISYGGGFWKLMFGRTGNFDITNKILGGLKSDPVNYNEISKVFIYDSDTIINLTWSASVGYTLTKKKKK
jgi:hypothetical protein